MAHLYNPHNLTFIQSRAEMNPAIITEYAEMMKSGVEFDPIEGIRDETGRIYIWDGQHRGEAAKTAGIKLAANLQPGSRRQAEWLALTANQKHGLRRTTADKQRVIRLALQHPNGVNLSNREIARHCGVDHKTVGSARKALETAGDIPRIAARQVTRNGVTYTQKIAKTDKNSFHKKNSVSGEIPRIIAQTTHNGTAHAQHPEPQTLNSELKIQNPKFEIRNPNCPRCHQGRIAGVNGRRRWCLNCGAEWPTAAAFLNEAHQREDRDPLPLRDQLLVRFEALLAKASTGKLSEISDWLVELENEILAGRRLSYNDNHDPHRRLLAATIKRAVDDLHSPEAAKQQTAVEFLSTEDGQFFLQKYGGLSARCAQEFVTQQKSTLCHRR